MDNIKENYKANSSLLSKFKALIGDAIVFSIQESDTKDMFGTKIYYSIVGSPETEIKTFNSFFNELEDTKNIDYFNAVPTEEVYSILSDFVEVNYNMLFKLIKIKLDLMSVIKNQMIENASNKAEVEVNKIINKAVVENNITKE